MNHIKNKNFFEFLILSFFTHCALLLLIYLFHINYFKFPRKNKLIIKPSVRVDIVGLPDQIEKKQTSKKKKKTNKTLTFKKKEAEKKAKKKKKKKIAKQKKDKLNKSDKKKEDSKESSKDSLRKGNQISKGGDSGEEHQQAIVNAYFSIIIDQIKRHWNLPQYLFNQNLSSQLEIKIDQNGRVITKKITQSSENEIFDSKVLQAIESATPFPVPPPEVMRSIEDGIVFQFP